MLGAGPDMNGRQKLPEANKEEVRRFLHRFKGIAGSRHIYLIDTDKTDQTLLQLGLTRGNCRGQFWHCLSWTTTLGPQPDL